MDTRGFGAGLAQVCRAVKSWATWSLARTQWNLWDHSVTTACFRRWPPQWPQLQRGGPRGTRAEAMLDSKAPAPAGSGMLFRLGACLWDSAGIPLTEMGKALWREVLGVKLEMFICHLLGRAGDHGVGSLRQTSEGPGGPGKPAA